MFCCIAFIVFSVFIIRYFSLRQTNTNYIEYHINTCNKNRKISEEKVKNNPLNAILSILNNKKKMLSYKKLSYINTTKKLKKHAKIKNAIYTEIKTKHHFDLLIPLSKKIQIKIKHTTTKYRAMGNTCIIEKVAKYLANGVLVKEQFNIFEEFKNLSEVSRVYKKEAKILNTLIILELLKIYICLANDVLSIKNKVLKAKKIKRIAKNKNLSPPTIYGIFLLNKQGMKFITENNLNIQKATTSIIEDLDQLFIKQKVVFNYIKFLSADV